MFLNKLKEDTKKTAKNNKQNVREDNSIVADTNLSENEDPAGKYLVKMDQIPQTSDTDENELMQSIKIDEIVEDDTETESPATKNGKLSLGNIDDLFDIDEEEEKTNLDILVSSLPEISCDEILTHVKNVKNLIEGIQKSYKKRGGNS